jgi:hypothetical protein
MDFRHIDWEQFARRCAVTQRSDSREHPSARIARAARWFSSVSTSGRLPNVLRSPVGGADGSAKLWLQAEA